MDVIIRNGLVVDGTGSAPMIADVGIKGDRIEAIAPRIEGAARTEIEAAGKAVIPGLIDPHVHEEWIGLVDGTYALFMAQGVTTTVNGNCGHSIAPGPLENIIEYYYGNGLMSERQRKAYKRRFPEWDDFEGYQAAMERAGTNLNLCTLMGHGTLRWTVMHGAHKRVPTEAEEREMEAILRHNMEQGAFGVSFGLDYVPGRYADTDELVRVAKVVGEYDGVAAAHLRHSIGVLESTREFIAVGERSGAKIQVSHLRPSCPEAFDAVKAYAARGGRVLVDTIPGSTAHLQSKDRALLFMMSTCDALFDQGLDGIKKAIRTPEGRALLRKDPYFVDRDHQTTILCRTQDPALEGRTVAELAAERHMDSKEFLLDLLASDEDFTLWAGGAKRSDFTMENHTRSIRENPYVCAGSDEILGDPEFPFDWYELLRRGAMPLFIKGNLARGMALEEVIRRNTSMVARHFGIKDRGELTPGFFADVAVVDLTQYSFPDADHVDYNKPLTVASGVEQLFVNGRRTVIDGEVQRTFAGRVLLRGR